MSLAWPSPDTPNPKAAHQASVSALEALEVDYELVRPLGSGGMADVYLGRDRILDREVAIKIIRAGLLRDAETLARFSREARTVARLVHPGIVVLHGARQLGANGLALIMAYCAGGSLRDRLRRDGALPIEQAIQIATDVAAALDHAHTHGVVHRDVKPENIFFDAQSGHALLADFGIATAAGEDSLTMTGSVLGTPHYMSPEQIRGEEVDGRADQYSLGCVVWECLAGAQPWAGQSLWSVVAKQESTPLLDVRSVRATATSAMAAAIARAVEKSRDARFGSCGAFMKAMTAKENLAVLASDALTVRFMPFEDSPGSALHSEAASERLAEDLTKAAWSVAGSAHVVSVASERSSNASGQSLGRELGAEEFARIPRGRFTMGSASGVQDEQPQRTVDVSAFLIQRTPITQIQWQSIMGESPSYFASKDAILPVERVSWEDVQLFLLRLNERDPNKRYRLPTEAEWEYAARAGIAGDFNISDVSVDALGWFHSNSRGRTHPVALKTPNAFGLFDTHGNVWEWVQDWYATYPVDAQADPTGPTFGANRVLRGGSWDTTPFYARSATRNFHTPSYRHQTIGFRLARTV